MPPGPGPLYNWLCVIHSASTILGHVAALRASQVNKAAASVVLRTRLETLPSQTNGEENRTADQGRDDKDVVNSFLGETSAALTEQLHQGGYVPEAQEALHTRNHFGEQSMKADVVIPVMSDVPALGSREAGAKEYVEALTAGANDTPLVCCMFLSTENLLIRAISKGDISYSKPQPTDPSLDISSTNPPTPRAQRTLQASRVPSSRLGRLFHYGGLAASLGYGAAAEVLRRTTRGGGDDQNSGSLMLTPANVKRLVDKLSKMRGAALKLGQFLSIQGMCSVLREVHADSGFNHV